jgi:hypothetical protein
MSSFVPSGVAFVPGVMNVLTDFDLFSGENGFSSGTVLKAMFAADVNAKQQTIVVIETSSGDACVVNALAAAGTVLGDAFQASPTTYGPDLAITRMITTSGGLSSIGPVHGFALNFSDFRLPDTAAVRGVQLSNCVGLDVTWIGVVGCVERITLPTAPPTTTTTATTRRTITTSTSKLSQEPTSLTVTTSPPPLTFGSASAGETDDSSSSNATALESSTMVGVTVTDNNAEMLPLAWWIYVVAVCVCVCLVLCGIVIGWFVWRRPRADETENDSMAMSQPMGRGQRFS